MFENLTISLTRKALASKNKKYLAIVDSVVTLLYTHQRFVNCNCRFGRFTQGLSRERHNRTIHVWKCDSVVIVVVAVFAQSLVLYLELSQRLSPLGLIFRSSIPIFGKMLLISFRIS